MSRMWTCIHTFKSKQNTRDCVELIISNIRMYICIYICIYVYIYRYILLRAKEDILPARHRHLLRWMNYITHMYTPSRAKEDTPHWDTGTCCVEYEKRQCSAKETCNRSHICIHLREQKRPLHIETQTLAALNMKRDNILQKRPIIDLTFVYTFESKKGHSTLRHRHLLRWIWKETIFRKRDL